MPQVNTQQKWKRRQKLWRADPCCYWCKRATFLEFGKVNGKPPNLASTLDHLVTRRIGRVSNDYEHTVLACYQCNSARNEAEQSGRTICRVTINAGGHPQYEFSADPRPIPAGVQFLDAALS